MVVLVLLSDCLNALGEECILQTVLGTICLSGPPMQILSCALVDYWPIYSLIPALVYRSSFALAEEKSNELVTYKSG